MLKTATFLLVCLFVGGQVHANTLFNQASWQQAVLQAQPGATFLTADFTGGTKNGLILSFPDGLDVSDVLGGSWGNMTASGNKLSGSLAPTEYAAIGLNPGFTGAANLDLLGVGMDLTIQNVTSGLTISPIGTLPGAGKASFSGFVGNLLNAPSTSVGASFTLGSLANTPQYFEASSVELALIDPPAPPPVNVTPEPSTWAMLGVGLIAFGCLGKSRKTR